MAGKPRTNTNLNLYRSFLAVYETKSIRAAADMAGITHSAVSQNITALNKQLGFMLFHSQSRGMIPTTYADSLYPTIRKVMNDVDALEDKMKVFGKDSPGVIKIVCTSNFGGRYITPHMVKFRKEFPNISFEIFNESIDDAFDMLEKGHADIMLSVIPLEKIKGFKILELETFPQTFFATKTFAQKHGITDSITISEFNKLPFLALRTLGNFINSDELKAPDISVDAYEMLAQVFPHDLGVSFGAWAIAQKALGDSIVKFSVQGIEPQNASMVCAHLDRDLPKVARAFVTLLTSSQDA